MWMRRGWVQCQCDKEGAAVIWHCFVTVIWQCSVGARDQFSGGGAADFALVSEDYRLLQETSIRVVLKHSDGLAHLYMVS